MRDCRTRRVGRFNRGPSLSPKLLHRVGVFVHGGLFFVHHIAYWAPRGILGTVCGTRSGGRCLSGSFACLWAMADQRCHCPRPSPLCPSVSGTRVAGPESSDPHASRRLWKGAFPSSKLRYRGLCCPLVQYQAKGLLKHEKVRWPRFFKNASGGSQVGMAHDPTEWEPVLELRGPSQGCDIAVIILVEVGVASSVGGRGYE